MRKIIFILILIISFTLTGCKGDGIELILNPGQDTVEINTEWIDAGAYTMIRSKRVDIETENRIDVTTLGVYEVKYTYSTDDMTYTLIRYVHVVDNIAPEITLNPGVDTILLNETWIDTGVVVSDNSLETITYTVTGLPDTSVAGEYQVTYTAIDSSGNQEDIIRVVTVIE